MRDEGERLVRDVEKNDALWALPESWAWATLEEMGSWGSGGTPSRKDLTNFCGDIPWLKIGDLTDGSIFQAEESISALGLQRSAAKIVQPETLLIAMYGSIGKVGITKIQCTTNQAIAFCSVNGLVSSNEYLKSYILARRSDLLSKGQGGTQANISQTILRAYPVPLAPLTEQRRIADKIDSLFARIEVGERALAEARAGIARYRKAVLKAAVTGELTADWRAENANKLEPADALLARILKERRAAWEREQIAKAEAKGAPLRGNDWKAKYKDPVAPDTEDLPDLPEGWVWTRTDVAGEVMLGRQRAPQHHSGDFMRPYLRVANVLEARLDLSDVKQMNFDEREFERYRLEPGDILLNEGQSPPFIGRPAMYRGEIEGCCFQKTLLRFRASKYIPADFAMIVFRSYMHSGRFKRSASITTNIGHLPLERLVEIEFPLPPTEEITEIVSRVEAALADAEQLDAHLEMQQTTAKALRQAVLKAAFEGRLVPQDPADEPASALLARIRAEREAAPPRRRSKDQD